MANIFQRIFSMPPPIIQNGDLFNVPNNFPQFVQVETDDIKQAGTVSKKWVLSAILDGQNIYRVRILKSIQELKEGDRIINLLDNSHILIGKGTSHPAYNEVKKNLKDWCKIVKL